MLALTVFHAVLWVSVTVQCIEFLGLGAAFGSLK